MLLNHITKFDWLKKSHQPLINNKFYAFGITFKNKYLVLNLLTGKVLRRTDNWVFKQFGRY